MARKRNLIEPLGTVDVMCDNKPCDYYYKNEENIELVSFLGMPCPKCGANLLTLEDYVMYKKTDNVIRFINKWFGWTTIFIKEKPENTKVASVHYHDGVTTINRNAKS